MVGGPAAFSVIAQHAMSECKKRHVERAMQCSQHMQSEHMQNAGEHCQGCMSQHVTGLEDVLCITFLSTPKGSCWGLPPGGRLQA
jgi:hypothetical protein